MTTIGIGTRTKQEHVQRIKTGQVLSRLPHLKTLRQRAYLSQSMLAEDAGLSEYTVRALESGRSKAQPATIQALAQALGISPEELIAGSRPMSVSSDMHVTIHSTISITPRDVQKIIVYARLS